MNNNVVETFCKFIKLINGKVTQHSIDEYIRTHPQYPSMLVYAEALNKWNIPYIAFEANQSEYQKVDTPHITYLRKNKGMFALVRKKTNSTIEWFDTEAGWRKESLDEFLKYWSGFILVAESDLNSGELNYQKKRIFETLIFLRIPLAVLALLIIFVIGLYYLNPKFSFFSGSLGMLKLIGLVLTSLLLIKSVDNQNILINKLCNVGNKANCQSILDSNAAKITSWLSLSDIGFIYYSSSLCCFLLTNVSETLYFTFLKWQFFINCISLLFCCFSIYYQAVIARIWCPLCIGVVLVLVIEFILNFCTIYLNKIDLDLSIPKDLILLGLISFLIPTSFLLLFKNTIIEAYKSQSLYSELVKIKRNVNVFELLSGNKRMPTVHERLGVVKIGNISAKNTITVISNPLCNPCAKIHNRIENILKESNNFNCQLIFLTNPNDIDVGGKFVRKIFSLPNNLKQIAIKEWFNRNDSNFNKWNEKYEIYQENKIAYLLQNEHRDWCNLANIEVTPTIFVNGLPLPKVYKVEDIINIFS